MEIEKLSFFDYSILSSAACTTVFLLAAYLGVVSRENYFDSEVNLVLIFAVVSGFLAFPMNVLSWIPFGRVKCQYSVRSRLFGVIPSFFVFLSATSSPV